MPNTVKLEVDGIDNRGTAEVMFGFVYFTDGARVTYATGHGVTGSTGGANWPSISAEHVRLAEAALNQNYPDWNTIPEDSN